MVESSKTIGFQQSHVTPSLPTTAKPIGPAKNEAVATPVKPPADAAADDTAHIAPLIAPLPTVFTAAAPTALVPVLPAQSAASTFAPCQNH